LEIKLKLIFGGITFCGIDLSDDNKSIIVGDFTGGINTFDIQTL
jgi:hypothetical protein